MFGADRETPKKFIKVIDRTVSHAKGFGCCLLEQSVYGI